MIDLSLSAGVLTVVATGDLDLAERARFTELGSQLARGASTEARALVVDLCGVDLVDSSGAVFLGSVAQLAQDRGGRAVLRGADAAVLFVLELCGVLGQFEVDGEHRCPPTTSPGPWRRSAARG